MAKYARFDGRTFPLPDCDLSWRLRYGYSELHPVATRGRIDMLQAASILDAYNALIELPRDERQKCVREIRAAIEHTGGEER